MELLDEAPANTAIRGEVPATPTERRTHAPHSEPHRPPGWDAGVRVLSVDDEPMLVEGLRARFTRDGSIMLLENLGSTEHLLDAVARLHPDVVLMGIELPGPDVFETAERLRSMHPRVRVIFFSSLVRDGYIAAAHACGARGYFAKSDDPETILAGIHEIARSTSGEMILGPHVRARCKVAPHPTPSESLAHTAEGGPATRLSLLSTREIEVLRLIGKGLSRTQIGAELCRSAKTIDGHQERAMRKLGITSRADLIRFAIHEGLAEA